MNIKTNYHTHHELCKHAEGTAEDYVKKALELGFEELGFSDHAPSRTLKDNARMDFEDLPVYLEDLERTASKYKGRIKIYKGFEIEYSPKNHDVYDWLLQKVDYLALGQHFLENHTRKFDGNYVFRLKKGKDLVTYAKIVTEAIFSGYFAFVAHPDIFLSQIPSIEDNSDALRAINMITQAAAKAGVPLEFNANGIRRGVIHKQGKSYYHYPRKAFFKQAEKHGCKIILSSDAHEPDNLHDYAIDEAKRLIDEWGITIEEKLVIRS